MSNLFYQQLQEQSDGKLKTNEDKIIIAKIDALSKAQTVILELVDLLECIENIYKEMEK